MAALLTTSRYLRQATKLPTLIFEAQSTSLWRLIMAPGAGSLREIIGDATRLDAPVIAQFRLVTCGRSEDLEGIPTTYAHLNAPLAAMKPL